MSDDDDSEHYEMFKLTGEYKGVKIPWRVNNEVRLYMNPDTKALFTPYNPEYACYVLNEFVAAVQRIEQLKSDIELLNNYGIRVTLNIDVPREE